jgi:AcrR family transcriptional regulator
MKRNVEIPQVRRIVIMNSAKQLFSKNYSETSVDEISRCAGVGNDVFYHYFASKQAVLEALVQELIANMAEYSRSIAETPGIGAIEKICIIVSGQQTIQAGEYAILDAMHRPENRALNDGSNIQTVKIFGQILASIIEQGNQEGIFQVDDPLGVAQFILAGSQLLLGQDGFHWTPQERMALNRMMLTLIERAFGADPGSFAPALGKSLAMNLAS